MEKINEKDSPQLIPGRKTPPTPWEDRKGKGMSAAELLTEKVADIIEQ